VTPACGTADTELRHFAGGGAPGLDEHVAGCDACQAFLAGLWAGRLTRDLSEPIVRAIRFEQWLLDVVRLGADVAARMAEATIRYTTGGEDQ
jgi:hypothetical protein